MLEILAHANLPHQFVLVSVHSSQLADVRENVLESVGKLERVHVVQAILDVGVDDQFGKAEDLAAQMECWKVMILLLYYSYFLSITGFSQHVYVLLK